MSIFNSSIIACKQCIPCIAQAQHVSYLQYFSRHNTLHVFVCKVGSELYCMHLATKELRLLKISILLPYMTIANGNIII